MPCPSVSDPTESIINILNYKELKGKSLDFEGLGPLTRLKWGRKWLRGKKKEYKYIKRTKNKSINKFIMFYTYIIRSNFLFLLQNKKKTNSRQLKLLEKLFTFFT